MTDQHYEVNCFCCGELKVPEDDEYYIEYDQENIEMVYVCGKCENDLWTDITESGDDISQEEINFLDWCDSQ